MAGWAGPVTLCAVSWLSLLRLVVSQGATTPAVNGTDTPANDNRLTESQRLAAIIVPSVIGGIVIIGILIFIFLKVREKRQTEGTYRPSSEEQSSGKQLGDYGKENLGATFEDEKGIRASQV